MAEDQANKKNYRRQQQEQQQGGEEGDQQEQLLRQHLQQQQAASGNASLQQQQQQSLQELSAATTLAHQLQIEQALRNAPASSLDTNSNINIPSIIAAASAAAHQQMNFPHPGAAVDSYGASSSQRQLLSALLSEGISNSRAAPPLQSLEALQRSTSMDRSQALSTVNRALQEQLLMSELLRSPSGTQRPSTQAVPLHLLDQRLPVPPFQENQQQQQQQNQASQQQQTRQQPSQQDNNNNASNSGGGFSMAPGAAAAALGMLPPRSMDLIRAQPNASLNLLATNAAYAPLAGAPLFVGGNAGGGKSIDVVGTAASDIPTSVLKGEDKEANMKNNNNDAANRMLPPRKRRKMVNFKLDHNVSDDEASSATAASPKLSSSSSLPADGQDAAAKVTATCPLPSLTQEGVEKVRRDTMPTLQSYKKLWGTLDAKASNKRFRKEFFRRRLEQGSVALIKTTSGLSSSSPQSWEKKD